MVPDATSSPSDTGWVELDQAVLDPTIDAVVVDTDRDHQSMADARLDAETTVDLSAAAAPRDRGMSSIEDSTLIERQPAASSTSGCTLMNRTQHMPWIWLILAWGCVLRRKSAVSPRPDRAQQAR